MRLSSKISDFTKYRKTLSDEEMIDRLHDMWRDALQLEKQVKNIGFEPLVMKTVCECGRILDEMDITVGQCYECSKLISQTVSYVTENKRSMNKEEKLSDILYHLHKDNINPKDAKEQILSLFSCYEKENHGWISTSKQLPPPHRKITFLTNDIKYPDNWWTGVWRVDCYVTSEIYQVYKNEKVTHWMLQPNEPSE